MKQNAKICAIGEQNVMKIEVFILGGHLSEEKEGMVEREKREDRDREKRDKRELSI